MRVIVEHVKESEESYRPRDIMCETAVTRDGCLVLTNTKEDTFIAKEIGIPFHSIFQWYIIEEDNGYGAELSRNRRRNLAE